jgi:hypothetical protein
MSTDPASTYIGQFFSGGIDPSTPHLVLILAAVAGGLAVGIGIIWEAARSGHLWTLPTALVFFGVVIEAAATVILFEFDEGISRAQQSQLIVAERHAVPGSEEQVEVTNAMKEFAGMPVRILSYDDDQEARTFTVELMRALHEANLVTPPKFERVSADDIRVVLHGIVIAGAPDKPSTDADSALLNVLSALRFCEAMPPEIGLPNIFGAIAPQSIFIFVGYKQTGGRNCK